MADFQILLLPKANYFQWVEAAKEYAAAFGAVPTNDPDQAGRYMAPQQTIIVAGAPNAYPAQGDIRAWLRQNYPNIRVDYVEARTPEDLRTALAARLNAGQPSTANGDFRLRWPTDYAKINQGFGTHPEIYRRYNLPGHAGLDIFAPHQARVYAGADGTVSGVEGEAGQAVAQPKGVSVRLQHRDGYESVYAPLHEALVKVGDQVREGHVIGLADAGGNDSGNRLHLTLKKQGATAAGLTPYPDDLLDPTPFLRWPDNDLASSHVQYPWPPGHCLAGVHGRADGRMQPADYPALAQARMEAVKLLTTATGTDVDQLRGFNSRMFIMVRLFASFDGRNVGAAEFVSWMVPEMLQFYQRGIRYFEVHNEPNLRAEGWTTSWNNGAEFGNWFLEVRARLKQHYPQALLGYPGLSPGEQIPGVRMRALDFLDGSDQACRAADWVGLHCYWMSEQELNSAAGGLGYLEYRRRFPEKVLFITEFSNVDLFADKSLKGQQYARYYQHLRSLPGLGAAFSFVISASSGFGGETWRLENGALTAIPAQVGARTDVATRPPPVPSN